ncbi:TRAP transporter large permease [Desulfuromonas acetexigens]|jgi:tripartite ATP-independent transporter DctM subunit|uniref:TRAP transporter large permease subunit n=1 Tax=Trichloromonas acetexigens TaxID=38815 RepID=A0A550J9C9_9BACT|nr:TRAP transporter large permease subunit [Desulfuromonas acetexigens]TRO79722.1 TRAP transporter large permease subunit [Desulfuromonas acetexigens]
MLLIALGLFLLALLGAPLFAIIAAGALLGYQRAEIDLAALAVEVFRLAEMPVLLAIPLFTLAGYLLGESGAPRRLVNLTQALFGWLPGSLAAVALVACAFFTAFTGASGVTIVALGALLYPALQQAGYDEHFNLGLITTSGSLGLLFAPSLPLILYGIVAQQTEVGRGVGIDQLFVAGLLPGLLMLVLLLGYAFWHSRRLPRERKTAAVGPGRALVDAAWELPLPFIVLGGIYSGYFAVSEAAAVTALYVLVVEVVILREITLLQLPGIVRQAMVMVGGILIILGVSLASTNVLIDAGVPERLFDWVQAHVSSRLTFLLWLNLFLLLLGCLLDIFSALVLVVPLILPVAVGFNVDPLHLGIIFLANMQIGYLTPPVGLNLFIASYRFDQPILTLYRATLPFLLLLLFCVLLITYWPWLSLGLVGG